MVFMHELIQLNINVFSTKMCQNMHTSVTKGRTRNPLGYTVTVPLQMAEACGFKRGSNLVFTPLSSGFSSHF